jgi:hypothetical protein
MAPMIDLKAVYKNISRGRKILRKQIEARPLEKRFHDETIQELLRFHPNALEKGTLEIEYLVVRPHRVFKTPTLYVKAKGRAEKDVSAKQCLRVLFGKKPKTSTPWLNLQRALRHAIYDGSRGTYLWEHRGEQCRLCERIGNNVDHYPLPFSSIVNDFLATLPCHPTITYSGYDYVLADSGVREAWRDYHDGRATFRMLCSQCNSSIGNRTSSAPEPAKKDNVVVNDQCQKGQVAVGLGAALKEPPLKEPVYKATQGVDHLCNPTKPGGVLVGTKTKAEVEVHRKGDGREVAVE